MNIQSIKYKKWCPEGCGKSIEFYIRGNRFAKPPKMSKYKCTRCKKIFNLKQLLTINNNCNGVGARCKEEE
jgi:DNA-directed RNA polymerase subunit RPC12/RpoP